ncbi:MAG: hypothetical protein V3T83_13585 [Acidobacteriota bacterium]
MDVPVNIALLLRKSCRTPEAVSRVEEIASRMGVRITQRGSVTISGKVSKEDCRRLFGATPVEVPAEPPGDLDFGRPGGYEVKEDLSVPDELAEYVESVSVIPPARRLW